jgi:hypothetical protein
LSETAEKFGSETLLIKIAADRTRIYLKFQDPAEGKTSLVMVVDEWAAEECQQLPHDSRLNKNTIYYSRDADVVHYVYLSEKHSKTQRGQLDVAGLDAHLEECIIESSLGQLDEPLICLDYEQNRVVAYSPDEPEFAHAFNDLLQHHKQVKLNVLDEMNVDESLFDTPQKLALRDKWLADKLLRAERRVFVPSALRDSFIERLKSTVTHDPAREIYANISFKGKKDGIFDYLRETLAEKAKCAERQMSEYLYFSEVPFSSREQEAERVVKVLHDLRVLKSGGLALKHEDVNESKYAYEGLKKNLEKRFESRRFEAYLGQVVALQGEIRSYRDGLKGFSLSLYFRVCQAVHPQIA